MGCGTMWMAAGGQLLCSALPTGRSCRALSRRTALPGTPTRPWGCPCNAQPFSHGTQVGVLTAQGPLVPCRPPQLQTHAPL